MKRITLLLCTLCLTLCCRAFVGGDLSLVPAYEAAGDVWLDEEGQPIDDLVRYVHERWGWEAVRVRLFVDPHGSDDPSVCQDLDYVKALGRRVKEAGMRLLVDFHYSDTWADPSHQRIPASWTDHTTAGLAASLYQYTYESVRALVEAGAAPDYVQLGNEVTYGLLWTTADGSYPTSSATYAATGYCPTWEAAYPQGSAFPRTAVLLNSGARAVHKAFVDEGRDSTEVKIILHTASTQHMVLNGDNFYRYIEQAGFTNYDVVGLSYYPFEDGSLAELGQVLAKHKREVQIVETAYFNAGTTPAGAAWPYTPAGQRQYLSDLQARLALYNNVSGVYYWEPEECGNGYKKTVMRWWLNRGLWMSTTGQRHALASPFIAAGVKAPSAASDAAWYTLGGVRVSEPGRGVYVVDGRKVARR